MFGLSKSPSPFDPSFDISPDEEEHPDVKSWFTQKAKEEAKLSKQSEHDHFMQQRLVRALIWKAKVMGLTDSASLKEERVELYAKAYFYSWWYDSPSPFTHMRVLPFTRSVWFSLYSALSTRWTYHRYEPAVFLTFTIFAQTHVPYSYHNVLSLLRHNMVLTDEYIAEHSPSLFPTVPAGLFRFLFYHWFRLTYFTLSAWRTVTRSLNV